MHSPALRRHFARDPGAHSHWIHTMLRCVLAAALAGAAIVTAVTPAVAQPNRRFTAQALRGELSFDQPPAVRLNGDAARLAPGARIRGQNNLLQMPASLAGQRLQVNYTLDLNGQILDVWILTPQERDRKPWPENIEQARKWVFNADAQAWSKP